MKLKVLRFGFLSYLSIVASVALILGILCSSFILICAFFPGFTGIQFSNNRYEGLDGLFSAGITPIAFLGYGIFIALITFWGFNLVLRLFKGISLHGEFEEKINDSAYRVIKLKFFSFLKLITMIAFINGVMSGLFIFVIYILIYYIKIPLPSNVHINITLSGSWWDILFKIYSKQTEYFIYSLLIPIVVFLFYNYYLYLIKGLTIYGEFKTVDKKKEENVESTSQPS